jgi:PKD repeat protein
MFKNQSTKYGFKILASLLLAILVLPLVAFAQDDPEITAVAEINFEAVITSLDSVELDKNIIFDASKSTHPNSEKELKYEWDFGDGNKKEGAEVVHTYTSLGQKTIILNVNDGFQTVSTAKEIFVYKKIIMFISDQAELQDRIEGFTNYARDRDVNILLIESYDSATEFISEEVLKQKLSEVIENLRKIDEIVIWTDGNVGLNALSFVKQKNTDVDVPLTFDAKTILVLSEDDQNKGQIHRQYDLLKPESIVIAKEAAIYPFIDSPDSKTFINRLEADGYDYSLINAETGQLQLWNFMSYFVNYLIDSGIPANTVILILMLPVIATIVSFMKQIIGITTFGVYTPSIITLTFWILGLKVGLLTLLIMVLVGTGARFVLKRFRLLYIPKMAVVLTAVALAILALLIISVRLNLFDTQFFSLSIFPMLILSTLTEKFVNIQTGKGFRQAIILTLETVLVSIIAYVAIGGEFFFDLKFTALQSFMLAYPEIILVIIVINIFLGRWTGLRLLEYVRFREVLRHVEEE